MKPTVATLACIACLATAGCAEILGLEPPDVNAGGGGTASMTTNTGGTSGTSTTTNTGTTTSSTGTAGTPLLMTFGGLSEDYALALAASPTHAVVGGSFAGSATFGSAPPLVAGIAPDAYAFGVDPSLSVIGTLQIGATDQTDGVQVITSVATNALGEVAFAGYFTGLIQTPLWEFSANGGLTDLFVGKVAGDGTLAWLRAFGSDGSDMAAGVAFSPTGDLVVVTGSVQNTVVFDGFQPPGYGGSDAFFATLNAGNGVVVYATRFGGPSFDFANALLVDASFNITVAGSCEGAIVIDGTQFPASGGATDAFIAHFEQGDKLKWAREFGDGESQRALALAGDPSNPLTLYVAGSYLGSISIDGTTLVSGGNMQVDDLFVVRLEEVDGKPNWARSFIDTGPLQAAELGLAARSTAVACVGAFKSGADFGAGPVPASDLDGFIVELTDTGQLTSTRFITGLAAQRARAAAYTSDGSLYVAGDFEGMTTFDGIGAPQATVVDGFLMRYPPSGSN